MPRVQASRSVSSDSSARREPESAFEHPVFKHLYARVLRDVADRRLDERTRKAAGRALAFLLREQVVTERVTTDVLAVLNRTLDVSNIVRTLLLGLADVSAPEKIAEWTRAVADRALAEGHLPSFISVMRILVELPGYDGTVPTRWRLSILRAAETQGLPRRVLLLAKAYARRFPSESWPWIRRAHAGGMVAMLVGRVTSAETREGRRS